MKRPLIILLLLLSPFVAALHATSLTTASMPFGTTVTWDSHSLIVDGHRVCPVMGEIHYSRLPADEWPSAIRRMKQGGVTLIATYVFWNHIEEQEGVFNWSGQRNLRQFITLCKEEGLPVVLRMGPWCHGEVRNGGLPDWLFQKGCKMRSQDSLFLHFTQRLYRQIFTQVQGLQWKDYGPVIACQFDNEYRGSGEYLMTLKRIALDVGFDLPFYTRTGWPELTHPVPFGEMLPLYGDYADGFWDKSTKECVGSYYQAFNFKYGPQVSSTMGAPDAAKHSETLQPSQPYPYFTCELGGGMATSYHRRPFLYAADAYAMAIVKLGSGSNLLGYYMYHGGTNPESTTGITLNEGQRTLGTANNDLPVKTYDFQCPLGEFGQTNPVYYRLRPLHLFMRDWGETLAPMEPSFPGPHTLRQGADSLRWAVRSLGDSGFVFVNNYERLQPLTAKKGVQLTFPGIVFPRITFPAATSCIFPVNISGIRYATAQLVAQRSGRVYMMQIPGIATTIAFQDGKVLKNVKPRGTKLPIYKNYYLLTQDEAEVLDMTVTEQSAEEAGTCTALHASLTKVKAPGPLRTISLGPAKVAEAPTEEDWQQAAVYRITLHDTVAAEQPSHLQTASRVRRLLSITYHGDCARLYADGRLVADNFYYGRPFLFALWRLPERCTELELRILPLQPSAPIYLPREAQRTAGEDVVSVSIISQ